MTVLATEPGNSITRSTLRDFRTNELDRDDIFQPDFCTHMVFYGSDKNEVEITPGALEELKVWNSKTVTFLPG